MSDRTYYSASSKLDQFLEGALDEKIKKAISGVPFKTNIGKNIVAGFIVNIIITFVLGLALDFIPVAGWIGSFFVGYLSIKMSAGTYVEALRQFHGNKSKSRLNYQQGFANFKNGNNNYPNSNNQINN